MIGATGPIYVIQFVRRTTARTDVFLHNEVDVTAAAGSAVEDAPLPAAPAAGGAPLVVVVVVDAVTAL